MQKWYALLWVKDASAHRLPTQKPQTIPIKLMLWPACSQTVIEWIYHICVWLTNVFLYSEGVFFVFEGGCLFFLIFKVYFL